MAIASSDELLAETAYFKDLRHDLGIPNADISFELLAYFEDAVVFLQNFDEHTTVQDIRAFLNSYEQRAEQHFCFLFHQSSEGLKFPSDSHSYFPIRFGNLVYGSLVVRKRVQQPDAPAFSLQLAHALSRLCGWLLHTCEQSMFIWSYQEPEVSISGTLTKREREVLTLMCHGHSQDAIAQQLCISTTTVIKHKQNIYQQLGVHTVRDALHVSYHCRLVSFLDELYEWKQ